MAHDHRKTYSLTVTQANPNPINDQALGQQKSVWDLVDFQQAHSDNQYVESKEMTHVLHRSSILLRNDGKLQKKASMVPDSTQDHLILQLIEEVNKLKAERHARIPDWNRPRLGLLIRRIIYNWSLACNRI